MTKIPHILIVYTGGTIGMIKDYKTNILRSFDFENIYNQIPELNQLHCSISAVSFDTPIDSSDMNLSYWGKIARIISNHYDKVDGFVVLHGSDTMSYTASAISFMFENLSKPIVFTGSQLPIGDLRTDAKENMITAIEIAASRNDLGKPMLNEVCVYFEYKLYRANRTTKISAEQFEAFSSPNYPPLAVSGVHLKFNKQAMLAVENAGELVYQRFDDNNIVLLKLYPGISESVVKHLLNTPDLKGVILETYGSGNAPTSKWFVDLLQESIDKGVAVVDVSQCTTGSVALGKYETSDALKNMGIINGFDMTTESAVAKLMYLLSKNLSLDELKIMFETSLRGEVTS